MLCKKKNSLFNIFISNFAVIIVCLLQLGNVLDVTLHLKRKKMQIMTTTEEAKNMRNGINIEGTVERKGETRTVNKKAGGTIDVCDAYLVDDVGEIKLTLWGDDIPKISDGSKVKITNGYTNTFKGEVSLTKGKYGQLEVLS